MTFKNIDELETGHLITRLTNDVVQIQQFFNMLLRMMIRAPPFMMLGSVALTFYVSVRYGLILVAMILVLIAIIAAVILKARPLFKKVQKQLMALIQLCSKI